MDMHFKGVIFQTHAAELGRRLRHPRPGTCVIDVRSAGEYAQGHIPGAISAEDLNLTTEIPAGTDQHTEFVLVGTAPGDPRVRSASLALKELGAHRRVELTGGMLEWRQLGYMVDEAAT